MNTQDKDYERKYCRQLEELQSQLLAIIPNDDNSALDLLENTYWDDALAQFVVLRQATPKGLAAFCQQDPSIHPVLIDDMLNNTNLLKQILLADGATKDQYGPAIKIYTEIQAKSEYINSTAPASSNIFHRLALAIALEHAVPMSQTNPKEPKTHMEDFVDPVRRYLNYENAYINGELDACFENLSVFELKFVVNGDEPDEISVWGRQMLRNFRSDHVLEQGYEWRYSNIVRSDVRYGSENVKFDLPELQKFQNIIMNGGVCGRRAFFGRFILRSFGIPTTARPSKGHGALCHYTPNQDWVVNLGGQWGCGWTKTRYKKDLDFLATCRARQRIHPYWKVKRAQWVGDVRGEHPVFGEHDDHFQQVGLYYGLSLKIQKAIIEEAAGKNTPQGLVLNEPKPSRRLTLAEAVLSTPAINESILYNKDKSIVLPAALAKFKRDVHVMMSFLGGKQIYLPSFSPQGLTIMRGGTWKNDANGCCSGGRMKSGGYGKYENWGFRVAMSLPATNENSPPPVWTLELGSDDSTTVTLELVYIQPGTFIMGGESTDDGRFECVEVPKHSVQITKGYYLGKYPVTQAQYQLVTKENPSKSTKAPGCPVDNIGEQDSVVFCETVGERTGQDVRLPTEAEWEYACRAGQDISKWFFGDDPASLGDYAWFQDNSNSKSHPVGQKKPNPWGLYDIYGNVCERVADKYCSDYYQNSPTVDPKGPSQGTKSHLEFHKIRISQSGYYSLTARVVTVNANQRLNVSWESNASNEEEILVLEMPFTIGEWQYSKPVTIFLQAGQVTLKFWRDKPPQYGLAIKEFFLKPLD